MKTSSFARFEI